MTLEFTQIRVFVQKKLTDIEDGKTSEYWPKVTGYRSKIWSNF